MAADTRGPVAAPMVPTPIRAVPTRRVRCCGSFSKAKIALADRVSGPGALEPRLPLELIDVLGLLHGEADIVEALHQAALAVGIDVEMDLAAVGPSDLLRRQIDEQYRVGAARGVVDQLV